MDLKAQLLVNTEFFFSISLDTLALIESERLVDTLFETETLLLVLVDTLPEVPTEKSRTSSKQTKNLRICTNNFVLGRFKHYLKAMAGLD